MKILITGTSGFIGGFLRHFFGPNNVIIGTVNSREPRENEIRADLTKIENISKLPLESFDIVINTIGMMDMTASRKKQYLVNAESTKNLVIWAKQTHCKHFIQISSVSVYGLKTLGENRTESNTKRYTGRLWINYGTSKAKAEEYIEKSGVPYTILRLPQVLGPNDKFLTDAIISGLFNKEIPQIGNEDRLLSVIYVKNLGFILDKIIHLGPTNDCYNCIDNDVRWSRFVNEFAQLLNLHIICKKDSKLTLFLRRTAQYKYLLMSAGFGAQYPADKLNNLIHYTPTFLWQQAVREMVEDYLLTHSLLNNTQNKPISTPNPI